MNSQPFELFYNKLVEYKDTFGDCLVEKDYICPDGYKLGKTVSRIRQGCIKTTLEQNNKLELINFAWYAQKFNFEIFYIKLLEYKQKYGSCMVPQQWKSENSYGLSKQIHKIQLGAIKLSEKQKDDLTSLGFIFNVSENEDANDL